MSLRFGLGAKCLSPSAITIQRHPSLQEALTHLVGAKPKHRTRSGEELPPQEAEEDVRELEVGAGHGTVSV